LAQVFTFTDETEVSNLFAARFPLHPQ